MDIIILVVIGIVAFWAGWHARGILFLTAMSENPDRIIAILEQIKKINVEEAEGNGEPLTATKCRAELVNGNWYIYSNENQFLGQGASVEEAMLAIKARFPNKQVWLVKPNEEHQSA